MLVVLDTNVLLSALLSTKGPPADIVKRWQLEGFEVATSAVLLAELRRALNYPKVRKYLKEPEETIAELLRRLTTTAILVDPQLTLNVIDNDESDNRVLECAKAAGAGFIVTGDDDLLGLDEYEGIVILSPAEFITFLDLQEKGQE